MNFGLNHYGRAERTDDFNSKIMLIAIFSLCFVILLVIILHIYARYFLRHPRRNTALTFIYRDLSQQHATEPMTAKSGLDPTVISLLPSFQFKQMEGHDDNIECAVCLSMLEEDESARRLPNCNHVFHMECIDRWLTSQSTCPICRSEASPRLAPLDREPPKGDVQLTEVVVVTSENEHEHEHEHDMQIVTNSSCNDCNNDSKTTNGNSPSSSASFRMSSFRKIIGRDRSSSFNRVQVSGEIDARRQVLQQSQAI